MYINISFSRPHPPLTKEIYMLQIAGYSNKFNITIFKFSDVQNDSLFT